MEYKVVFILQRCQNCNMSFSWNKIFKAFWGWVYRPVECDNCGAEHKITIPGRFIFVSLTIFPMLLFTNFLSPFDNLFATLGIGFAIFIIGFLFVPYFVRFKIV
ncbi:TIGR04104 family putative zinc finger protein [Lentibacillus kapialis]|uniref:TIGR04104 family putative zinc finger protein n=1 Tax=Lentibacillus kapialis TaxID=340214 RepID=UPI0016676BA3